MRNNDYMIMKIVRCINLMLNNLNNLAQRHLLVKKVLIVTPVSNITVGYKNSIWYAAS